MRILVILWTILAALRLVWTIAVRLAEALFWVVHFLIATVAVGRDVPRLWRSLRTGDLSCPSGHEIRIDQRTLWECEACKFTWRRKSPLACPSCGAVTPFLRCGVCLEATPNPYRLGARS